MKIHALPVCSRVNEVLGRHGLAGSAGIVITLLAMEQIVNWQN